MREGNLYTVTFLDHAIGTRGVVKCTIVGWLMEEREDSYRFTYWITFDEDDLVDEDNLEPFEILKSAIIRHELVKERLYA